MDVRPAPISPHDLYVRLGTAAAPVLLDVRRQDAFDADDALIVGAIRRAPETVSQWQHETRSSPPVVVYCVHGHEVSQTAAASLANAGIDAAYLAGGIARWRDEQLPTRRKSQETTNKWVTRERPKIDRIACPWLIRRFIDPQAEFLYVRTNKVVSVAAEMGAIPYDIEGVTFAHEGERCSFDTIVRIFGISDPALDRLATIVRGADTSRHDLAPQCSGLFAISLGLSANFPDDQEMLRHGLVMYDALFTWCRSLQQETHNWPVKAPQPAAV
jgi:rhodanese-related sulfurtransferase